MNLLGKLLIICAMQEPGSLSRSFTTFACNYVTDGILQVDAYEQGRPGYPLDAVQYALKEAGLDTGRKTIIDLAAGTGKLTRSASITVMRHPVLVLCKILRIAMPAVSAVAQSIAAAMCIPAQSGRGPLWLIEACLMPCLLPAGS